MESPLRVLALLGFTLALAAAPANAYEFGTSRDRDAVRWDAQRLLARTIAEEKKTPADLVITDVVTDGDWALAVYHIGDYQGFMTLHKFWGQWWDMADGAIDGSKDGVECAMLRTTPPVTFNPETGIGFGLSDECLKRAGLPDMLIAQARNIDAVKRANAAKNAYVAKAKECRPLCGKKIIASGGAITDPYAATTAGFVTTLSYGKVVALPPDIMVSHFYGRAPTEMESTQQPHGDAFYFFTLELSGSKPVTFPEGTALDVWFPHVLFPNLRYRITAGWANTSFGPIKGSLADNTLHFVLPRFTLEPGESMMYEIDGDP